MNASTTRMLDEYYDPDPRIHAVCDRLFLDGISIEASNFYLFLSSTAELVFLQEWLRRVELLIARSPFKRSIFF